MACENIAKCIFFNDKMANKPGTATLLKKTIARATLKTVPAIWCAKNWGVRPYPQTCSPTSLSVQPSF